jgi:hypothetical protein
MNSSTANNAINATNTANNPMKNNLDIIVEEISSTIKLKLEILMHDLLVKSDEYDETNRILLSLPVVKKLINKSIVSSAVNDFFSDVSTQGFPDIHNIPNDPNKFLQTCTFNYDSLNDVDVNVDDSTSQEDNEDHDEKVSINKTEDEVVYDVIKDDEDVEDDDNEVEESEVEQEEESVLSSENILLNIEEKVDECTSDFIDKTDIEQCDEEEAKSDELEEDLEEEIKSDHDELEEDLEEEIKSDDDELEEDLEEEVKSDDELEDDEEEVKSDDEVEEEDETDDDGDKVEDENDEDEEVFEIEINGKTYFTTNEINGLIYSADENNDPGDEVGKFVKGVATFV